MDHLAEKTTIDSNLSNGKTLSLEVIIDLVASGMSMEEIMKDHPELGKDDMLSSFEFAKTTLW